MLLLAPLALGVSVSSGILQRKLLETFQGLSGIVYINDDVHIHWHTVKDQYNNLEWFLQRCTTKDIKLDRGKLHLHLKKIAVKDTSFSRMA